MKILRLLGIMIATIDVTIIHHYRNYYCFFFFWLIVVVVKTLKFLLYPRRVSG